MITKQSGYKPRLTIVGLPSPDGSKISFRTTLLPLYIMYIGGTSMLVLYLLVIVYTTFVVYRGWLKRYLGPSRDEYKELTYIKLFFSAAK